MKRRIIVGVLATLFTVSNMWTSSAPVSAKTSARAQEYWGRISVAQKTWRTAPFLESGGTNYIGIWYVLELFRQYGMTAVWDGKSLSVNWVPDCHLTGNITLGGKAVQGAHTVTVNGTAYADVTALAMRLGWRLRLDANHTLEIESGTGGISVGTAPRGGHFIVSGHAVSAAKAGAKQVNTPKPVAVSQGWASISGGGTVPVLQANGTCFIGIWYIQHFLEQYGYHVTWQNGTLKIAAMPQVIPNGSLAVDSADEPSALVRYQSRWYVPVTNLMSLTNYAIGIDGLGNASLSPMTTTNLPSVSAPGRNPTTTVSGSIQGVNQAGCRVAFLTQGGGVQVLPVTASGAFSGQITGKTSTVIGIYSPSKGWTATVQDWNNGAKTSLQISPTQTMSEVSGRIIADGPGASVGGVQLDVRDIITHAHYLTQTDNSGEFHIHLPAGAYEAWSLTPNGVSVFLGRPFLAAPGQTTLDPIHLPAMPKNGTYSTPYGVITAQGRDVSPLELISIGNMFQRIYRNDVTTLGIKPPGPVKVQVFENTKEYTQHFLDEGYSLQDATDYGQQSQAASEGPQSIVVNMEGLNFDWGINIMAHEFTHCLISTVSTTIPDWLNEGLAWEMGVRAEENQTPDDFLGRSFEWNQWEDIVNHAKRGDLYPLGSANSLATRYNVEAQDYFAVNCLISQFGLSKVLSAIQDLDKVGEAKAFQQAFGEPESSFFHDVTRQLQHDAQGVNAGMTITVRVSQVGLNQIFVSNPLGKTYWFKGFKPRVYSFVCTKDGQVIGPPGVGTPVVTSGYGDGTWDIGGDNQGAQGVFSISNAFGLGYLTLATLFPTGSNAGMSGMATGLPTGMQLVEVVPDGG